MIMVLLSGLTARAQHTEVSWSTFTAGFGVLSDGNADIRVVTGQPFVGALEGPGTSVGGGFLYNPAATGLQPLLAVSVQEGWNMVSLPVSRDSSGDSVRQVFPTAAYEHGFAYVPGIGYAQQYRMSNALGYWIKFPASELAYVAGAARLVDTFHVQAGWNFVGSISSIIDTATIISDPPSNRISPWFGYVGAFTPVTVITPGYAYWVKAETTGVFILSDSTAPTLHTPDPPAETRK
jgi:hypothetical protein